MGVAGNGLVERRQFDAARTSGDADLVVSTFSMLSRTGQAHLVDAANATVALADLADLAEPRWERWAARLIIRIAQDSPTAGLDDVRELLELSDDLPEPGAAHDLRERARRVVLGSRRTLAR